MPDGHLPSIEFIKFKETKLKLSRFDNDASIIFQSSNVTRASYEISLLITNKKNHTQEQKL